MSGSEDVIFEAIKDLPDEGGDGGADLGDEGGGIETQPETPPAETVEPVAGAEPAEPVEVPSDPLLAAIQKELDDLGFKMAKPGERERRVPLSQMRSTYIKLRKAWDERVGKELEELTGKYTTEQKRAQSHQSAVDQFNEINRRVIEGDPKEFLQEFVAANPRYAPFIVLDPQAVPARATATTSEEPMPQPDVKLPDGTMTYSFDQLKKRDEWAGRMLRAQAVADAQKILDDRLGPIEKDRKDAVARRKAEQENAKILADIDRDLEVIQKMPMFAEESVQKAVLEAINGGMGIWRAYATVVIPKLVMDQKAMREQIKKEWDATPKPRPTVPGAGRPAASSERPGRKRTSQDIIMESIAHLG